MKNIVRKAVVISSIIALSTIALITTTIYINERTQSDKIVLDLTDKERLLSQKIVQEIFYYAQQPKGDINRLNSLIDDFEIGLEDLINGNNEKGIYPPPSIETYERIKNAKRVWLSLKEQASEIGKTKEEVVAQSENFLQLTPRFFQATLEVAQMMERRRLPQRMVIEAENQIGLANNVVILSASYLATADENTLNELYSTIESYAATLDGFSNTDLIVHGSILALLADNQLLWEGFQDATIRAVSGKKRLIDKVQKIYLESSSFFASIEMIASEYSSHSQKIITILQWIQYISFVLLIIAFGYSIYLIWQIKEYCSQFFINPKVQKRSLFIGLTNEPVKDSI